MRTFQPLIVAALVLLVCLSSAQSQSSQQSSKTEAGGLSLLPGPSVSSVSGPSLSPEEQEQEKIDTIIRAFNRLPTPELERLGVDIQSTSEPILQGSTKAELLKRAWLERQKELKIAMESMTKPAEHMGELARRLNVFASSSATAKVVPEGENGVSTSTSTSTSDTDTDSDPDTVKDISNVLEELESTLTDIDNARDFYTIGGWPILVKMLSEEQHEDHRARAAWAIGTAIKNSYDYQLWVLENSCLQMIVRMLSTSVESTTSQLERRALYALSSALRGNVDVQEALLNIKEPSTFEADFYFLALSNHTNLEIPRKIWSLVSDMLQETGYVRGELASELAQLPEDKKKDVQEQVKRLNMLGDVFCSNSWASLASTSLRHIGSESLPLTAVPLRATLISVLQSTIEILEQCPTKLQSSSDTGSRNEVNLVAIINDQAQQLLLSHGTAAATTGSEGDVDLDPEDDLDERLVSTYPEEIVELAKKIVQLSTHG